MISFSHIYNKTLIFDKIVQSRFYSKINEKKIKVFRKIKLPNKKSMFLIAKAKISKRDVFW